MAEDLTAIVVALIGGEELDRSVGAVARQVANVLVVRRDGAITDATGNAIGKAGRLDIPGKRKSAIELASTGMVALVEDTVIPCEGWASAAATALKHGTTVAAGGPVIVDRALPPSSRALALSEYGEFNDHRTETSTTVLPGCNLAFRREAVVQAMAGPDGMVDQIVFRNLRKAGGEISWSPAMAVTFAHPNPGGARLRTRFNHGRIYASAEARNAGPIGRASRAGKALLLPPVLTLRGLQHATAADWRSLPTLGWLALQQTAWAAGEFVGATLGPSRKGLGQWQ